jgi:sulfofructose kinase
MNGQTSTAARVLGVGHVALDHLFSVTALPTRAVKTPAHRHRSMVGGMTASACVAAARLGASARFVSPVGDDAAVSEFAAHFEREGVDARGMVRVPGATSSISAIVVDATGERLIINHRGNALVRAPAFDSAWLEDTDLLLADPRCLPWAEAALRGARRRGLPSVLDADASPREDLQRLVGLATWTVFSEPGCSAYLEGPHEQALGSALAAGAQVAVVTLGERGLVWQRAGAAPQRLPAWPVAPVIDTTAAGDVFHGALGVALAEGQGDDSALRFAAAAAALKCLQADGVLGAPRRAAVEQLLRSAAPVGRPL